MRWANSIRVVLVEKDGGHALGIAALVPPIVIDEPHLAPRLQPGRLGQMP